MSVQTISKIEELRANLAELQHRMARVDRQAARCERKGDDLGLAGLRAARNGYEAAAESIRWELDFIVQSN